MDRTKKPEYGMFRPMYVSFGFSTTIFLGVFFALNMLLEEITFPMIFGLVVAITVGLLPINFRISRSLWINLFFKYEGPCNQIPKKVNR